MRSMYPHYSIADVHALFITYRMLRCTTGVLTSDLKYTALAYLDARTPEQEKKDCEKLLESVKMNDPLVAAAVVKVTLEYEEKIIKAVGWEHPDRETLLDHLKLPQNDDWHVFAAKQLALEWTRLTVLTPSHFQVSSVAVHNEQTFFVNLEAKNVYKRIKVTRAQTSVFLNGNPVALGAIQESPSQSPTQHPN
jgi:hypothetical protein